MGIRIDAPAIVNALIVNVLVLALGALGGWAGGIFTSGWIVEHLGGARRTEVTALESRVKLLEERVRSMSSRPYSKCEPEGASTCSVMSPNIIIADTPVPIDYCGTPSPTSCGQPAADTFCGFLGYGKATGFEKYDGAPLKTYRISERRVLSNKDFPRLDSFAKITCGR